MAEHLDIVVSVSIGEKIRRTVVSGERKIVVSGLFAVDTLEEEVRSAAGTLYRDLVHPIVVEEKDGPA